MGVHMSMGARRQGGEPGVCRVIRASGGRLCRGTAGGRLADAARTGVGEAPRGRGETGSPARRVPALASVRRPAGCNCRAATRSIRFLVGSCGVFLERSPGRKLWQPRHASPSAPAGNRSKMARKARLRNRMERFPFPNPERETGWNGLSGRARASGPASIPKCFPKHPGGSAASSAQLRHPRASNVSQAARAEHGHSPCAPRLPSGQPPGSARTSFTLSRERAPAAHALPRPRPTRLSDSRRPIPPHVLDSDKPLSLPARRPETPPRHRCPAPLPPPDGRSARSACRPAPPTLRSPDRSGAPPGRRASPHPAGGR